jgi:hypothetical protein
VAATLQRQAQRVPCPVSWQQKRLPHGCIRMRKRCLT